MAIQSINTLKNWFKRGFKPLQQQFYDWMDSYWHKEEAIPMSKVDQLETTLNTLYSTKAPLGADGKVPIELMPPGVSADIINIGNQPVSIAQKNTIQVSDSGDVFFVDKDGDVQQLEFGAVFKQRGNSFATDAELGTLDNFALMFKTNAEERMRVASDGKIGIGTTNPVTKLHVRDGDIFIDGFSFDEVTPSGKIQFGGGAYIYLDTNGKLSLSGAANAVKTDVGFEPAAGINGHVSFTYGNLTLNKGAEVDTWLQSSGQDLRIQAGSGYNLLLNQNNGNVLVGTSTDNGLKLQVAGDAYVSGKLRFNTGNIVNNSLYTYMSNWGGSAGYIGFGFAGTSTPALSDSVFDIYQGVATAPGDLFAFKHTLANNTGNNAAYSIINISTDINQTNGTNGVVRGIYYNPAITALNGEHRAIETVTGNVLLGTTSGNTLIGTSADEGYKLDVNGNTRINGSLTMATDSNSLGYITNNSIYGGFFNFDFTANTAGAGGGIRLRHAGNIYAQIMTASPTNPYAPTGLLLDVSAGNLDSAVRTSGKLFRWGRTNTMNGSGAQMTFDPFNVRLIIGTAADNGATLQVNGATTATSDIEVSQAGQGLILKSPNGTRYRLTVADNGTLTTTAL